MTKRFFRDPRFQIFLILIALWIIAIIRRPVSSSITHPLFAVILFSSFDLLYTYYKSKSWYYPFSSWVSGLLIGLLISPSAGLLITVVATAFGFFSKHFIKYKSRQIFNPAAFGLIVTVLLLHTSVSWWAVAPGGISILVTLISLYTLKKYHRLQIPLVFMIGYFIFLLFTTRLISAVRLTLDGTVMLFAFIMLPEPATSQIKNLWKYGFPILAVLGVIILSVLKFDPADQFLTALLITNIVSGLFT